MEQILVEIMLPFAVWELRLKYLYQQENDSKNSCVLARNGVSDNAVEVMDWRNFQS